MLREDLLKRGSDTKPAGISQCICTETREVAGCKLLSGMHVAFVCFGLVEADLWSVGLVCVQ